MLQTTGGPRVTSVCARYEVTKTQTCCVTTRCVWHHAPRSKALLLLVTLAAHGFSASRATSCVDTSELGPEPASAAPSLPPTLKPGDIMHPSMHE